MQDISNESLLYGMNFLLTGDALSWFQVYRGDFCDDFEKFGAQFMAYFWNKGLQNKLRSAILASPRNDPTLGSYANYFLNYTKHAKYLDAPLDPIVVIESISTHFPDNVQVALAQNKSETTESVVTTLQIFDQLATKYKQAAPKFNVPPPHFDNQKSQNQKSNQRCNVNQISFDLSVPPPLAYEPFSSDEPKPEI